MKAYTFKTIINKGRFKNYYYSLTKEEQIKIKDNVINYAEKYKKYSDSKNLEFLVNLIFVLGAYDALKEFREDREKVVKELSSAMHDFLQKKVSSMNKAFNNKFIYSLLKLFIPKKMNGFNNHGWQIEGKSEDNNIYVTVKKCLVHEILKEEGKLELGPMFCNADLVLYMNLPKTEFKRKETLIKGGEVCDMNFIRHNEKNFDRFNSV